MPPEPPIASIESISDTGEITITFSEDMKEIKDLD